MGSQSHAQASRTVTHDEIWRALDKGSEALDGPLRNKEQGWAIRKVVDWSVKYDEGSAAAGKKLSLDIPPDQVDVAGPSQSERCSDSLRQWKVRLVSGRRMRAGCYHVVHSPV